MRIQTKEKLNEIKCNLAFEFVRFVIVLSQWIFYLGCLVYILCVFYKTEEETNSFTHSMSSEQNERHPDKEEKKKTK